MSDSGTAFSLQATPGPFWRDRGFWVQFIVQSVIFVLFGGLDVVSAFNTRADGGSLTSALVLFTGYTVTFVGLLAQRRRPETGLVVVAVGLLVAGAALSETYSLAAGVVGYEAWFISGYVRRRRRLWLTALVTGAVAGAAFAVLAPAVDLGWSGRPSSEVMYGGNVPLRELVTVLAVLVVLIIVSVALCWQLGLGVRRQHERMESLAARAELAAVAERNRIAREMHDIVAHSLTAVIAQADGGRYAGRKDPDKAIEALDTISATGREALAQMRQLLSVLREDGTRDTSAAPGVSGVPGLVEDARRSGLQVTLDIVGDARDVGPTVGLTVYRTVQEALTNVLKHAGKVPAQVVLDWSTSGRLDITVDNAPGAPGQALVDDGSPAGGAGGQGLVGLTERARVHGGTASWGPSEVFPGGWRVAVMLAV